MRAAISKSNLDTAGKLACSPIGEVYIRTDMVEVVIVTHNSAEYIKACIDSITALGVRSVVVDNGSTDDTVNIIRSRYPEVRIIETGENLGYGKALNLGFKATKSEFVILSNADVVYLTGSIGQLVAYLKTDPAVGVTAPQQMFPDCSWQRSYGHLPGFWSGMKDAVGITGFQNRLRRYFWPQKIDRNPREVPYVDGAVLAVRRKAFMELGGFDEDFFFYSDEADFCARLTKAGWKVVFFPKAEVIHVRGASSAKVNCPERFVRYMVEGQYLLAIKHLPRERVRAYAKLQIVNYSRLALMSRLVQWFGGRKSSDRIRTFDAYVKVWREFSQRPELAHTSTPGGNSHQAERLP